MYAIAQTFTNARFFHKSHAIRTVLGEIGKLINQSVWRQMKTYDDTMTQHTATFYNYKKK